MRVILPVPRTADKRNDHKLRLILAKLLVNRKKTKIKLKKKTTNIPGFFGTLSPINTSNISVDLFVCSHNLTLAHLPIDWLFLVAVKRRSSKRNDKKKMVFFER